MKSMTFTIEGHEVHVPDPRRSKSWREVTGKNSWRIPDDIAKTDKKLYELLQGEVYKRCEELVKAELDSVESLMQQAARENSDILVFMRESAVTFRMLVKNARNDLAVTFERNHSELAKPWRYKDSDNRIVPFGDGKKMVERLVAEAREYYTKNVAEAEANARVKALSDALIKAFDRKGCRHMSTVSYGWTQRFDLDGKAEVELRLRDGQPQARVENISISFRKADWQVMAAHTPDIFEFVNNLVAKVTKK